MQTTGLLLLVFHLLYFHVLGELVGVDDSRVSLDVHQHKRGSDTSERGKRITGYVRLVVTHRLLVEDKRPGRSLWAIDREEDKTAGDSCTVGPLCAMSPWSLSPTCTMLW